MLFLNFFFEGKKILTFGLVAIILGLYWGYCISYIFFYFSSLLLFLSPLSPSSRLLPSPSPSFSPLPSLVSSLLPLLSLSFFDHEDAHQENNRLLYLVIMTVTVCTFFLLFFPLILLILLLIEYCHSHNSFDSCSRDCQRM